MIGFDPSAALKLQPQLGNQPEGEGGASSPLPTELIWAAGFFDGEGNVTATRTNVGVRQDGSPKASISPRAQLGHVRLEPIKRFHEAVGVGNLMGPYADHRANHSAVYKWAATGSKAFTILWNQLGPYLSAPKREQFHETWTKVRDFYATADVRRRDPRAVPPEPTI